MDQPQKIIRLTNATGTELTEDSDMPGMYVISAAETADVYLSWDGSLNAVAILDQFFIVTGNTLEHSLQLYVAGAWKAVVAWESGTLDAPTAQRINAS